MRPTADSDWLNPDPVDVTADTERPAPFAGVYRIEAQGEDGVPFPTLLDATSSAPMSPEAEIRGKGGCLAQATPDHAGWAITELGARRIEQESAGMIRHDVNTVLAVMLREDFEQVAS